MALGAANCLLAWPNYVLPQYAPRTDAVVQKLTPTFSGGSWQATMPLANLGTGKLYKPVRSTDATNANTKLVVDFQTDRPVRVVALMRHTLSNIKGGDVNAPQWRVTLGDDNTFVAFTYQSAWTSVFSAMYAPASLPSGWNPAWFTGGPTIEDVLAYASLSAVIDLGQNYIGRYLQIEMQDAANGNGYVQMGGVFAGPAYQPRINLSYGAKIGGNDLSTKKDGDTGVEFWTTRPIQRIAEIQLDNIQSDEALELPLEMQMRVGLAKQLFFCMDPSSPYHMHRLSFPARLKQLSPLDYPYYDRLSAPIQLAEVL